MNDKIIKDHKKKSNQVKKLKKALSKKSKDSISKKDIINFLENRKEHYQEYYRDWNSDNEHIYITLDAKINLCDELLCMVQEL